MRSALRALVGLALLAFGVYFVLASGARPGPPAAIAPTPEASPSPPTPTVAPTPAAPTPKPPIPAGYRIKIPRLGIDLPIQEGDVSRDVDAQQTPEDWAFHFPQTGFPGEGSNTYLYSHARVGMFLSLWSARLGDEVLIEVPDGRTLRYTVSEVHPRVPPGDTSWLQPTNSERLTLQTSTGAYPEDPRFVVIAIPAG
jgi:LPXTG-site transpeptidase (sortase) family protein